MPNTTQIVTKIQMKDCELTYSCAPQPDEGGLMTVSMSRGRMRPMSSKMACMALNLRHAWYSTLSMCQDLPLQMAHFDAWMRGC
eukprot:366412-Chlamydomonas_euryale.AAC.11